jgi:hypothetical protein
MEKYIRFNVEMPIITATQLNTEQDMQEVLIGLKSGRQTLVGDKHKVDNLRVEDGRIVSVTYSNFHPNNPIRSTVAYTGDFAVWNQLNQIHIVSPDFNMEWSDDLMPQSLLTPIARRKII